MCSCLKCWILSHKNLLIQQLDCPESEWSVWFFFCLVSMIDTRGKQPQGLEVRNDLSNYSLSSITIKL